MSSISCIKDSFSPLPRIAIVAGGLMALGGIFITLAACQILPHGINALSQLGSVGQGIGYSVIAAGSVTLIAAVIAHLCLSKKLHREQVSNEPLYVQTSFQSKDTLEELFADELNFLWDIPNYPKKISDLPELDTNLITNPLTQGCFGERFPFIAIKLKCLSSAEEISNLDALNSLARPVDDPNRSETPLKDFIEPGKSDSMLVLFFRNNSRWMIYDQICSSGHSPKIATSFLRGFTGTEGRSSSLYPTYEGQALIEAETKGLAALKKLMKGEEVSDLKGIRWKLDQKELIDI